ncbi:hypothetical protein [Nioella aestuarii]|uniref:VHL beta domain-containing protein n=1 Tax=Nioella aestuarii TaxID=1662864 RepID=UPI003D7FC013
MRRIIFGLALLTAGLVCTGQVSAQDQRVWEYRPSEPGVLFQNQPGLTYWMPYAEPPVFDSTCHLTEQGTANVNMMLQMSTSLPNATLQSLSMVSPNGQAFRFDATISHSDASPNDATASISIPIEHPAAVGLTHWPRFSAMLPDGARFDLVLSPEAHQAATEFLADCATLPTAPPPVPGPPEIAWHYQPGTGSSGGVLSNWFLELSLLEFEATCTAPGMASIRMAAQADPMVDGQAARLRLNGPDGQPMLMDGTLFRFEGGIGDIGFAVDLPLEHPLFEYLLSGNYLGYGLEGHAGLNELDVTQAGTAVSAFLGECAPSSGASGAGGAGLVPPSDRSGCADYGQVQSQPGVAPFQATFVNRQQAARVLFWIDYQGQPQQMAYLDPGYQVTIGTDQAHVWLVTDSSGQCRGMVRPVPERPVIELVE